MLFNKRKEKSQLNNNSPLFLDEISINQNIPTINFDDELNNLISKEDLIYFQELVLLK